MAPVGIKLAIALLIGRNWAYVTTYRLYLDRSIAAPMPTSARPHWRTGSLLELLTIS